jgi:nucleoside phosphorylase
MRCLREEGVVAVGMEVYGILRALEPVDVPTGVLLYVMDLPMEGTDLGKTNYDLDAKSEVIDGNRRMNEWTLVHLGLIDPSVVTSR